MQHVATGEPISSRSLAKCGRFQLSPASLRNVMADLEDLGYLAAAAHLGRPRPHRPRLPLLHRSPDESRDALAARARDDRRSGQPRQRDRRSAASRLARPVAAQRSGRRRLHAHAAAVHDPQHGLRRSSPTTRSCASSSAQNGVVVNKIIETRSAVHARRAARRSAATSPIEFGGLTLDSIRRRLIRMTEEERAHAR